MAKSETHVDFKQEGIIKGKIIRKPPYVLILLKIIPWKFHILNPTNSRVIHP